MMHITIVGAGVQGTRMAGKYARFPDARLRAVISLQKPEGGPLAETPFFADAAGWKEEFGRPSRRDLFDLCVHHGVLVPVLEELIAIGGRNFILPKPIALTHEQLARIEALEKAYNLRMLVASQWHYCGILARIKEFLRKNTAAVSNIEIEFSRTFDAPRSHAYDAHTAFLPHLLQMASSLGLLAEPETSLVEHQSQGRIVVHIPGVPHITLTSDLAQRKRTEKLSVFLRGERRPALVADFAGKRGPSGFIEYPSITQRGKKRQVREDVLEQMLKQTLAYFDRPASARLRGQAPEALTLGAYLPVARELLHVALGARGAVAVIGGGIFGIMSALEIAAKGHPVTLLEKEADIMLGASLVNQCRVHMGYHYPRDEKTAQGSRGAKHLFEQMFAPAIRKIHNYYLVAKEGSKTHPDAYAAFCRKMDLPHKEQWPGGVQFSRDKIALSLKVPETIFDAKRIRGILKKKVAAAKRCTVLTNAPVVRIKASDGGYEVAYRSHGKEVTAKFAAVVNAAYGGANYINKLAGLPLRNYQYELCEMPVVRAPWKGTGWSIVDGPFFGAMPFGFSKDYLLYDVELSVLERSIGELPDFAHDATWYDGAGKGARRLERYKKKWGDTVPEVSQCEYLYSLYVVRVVLPKVEKTDARPTIVDELMPGLWQIFSGKVTTSVPQAAELAQAVDAFLRAGTARPTAAKRTRRPSRRSTARKIRAR